MTISVLQVALRAVMTMMMTMTIRVISRSRRLPHKRV